MSNIDRSTILSNISNDYEIENLSKSSAEDFVKKLELLKHEQNHKLLYAIKNSTTYLIIVLQWLLTFIFVLYIAYFLYLKNKKQLKN